MKSYVKYPPRPLQSEAYTGPMTATRFRPLQQGKDLLKEKGIKLPELQ